MNVWNLVCQEIRHRKSNFLLGLLSVAVAVACLIGSLTLLDAHEFRTAELLAQKEAEHRMANKNEERQVEKAFRQEQAALAEKLKKKEADEQKKLADEKLAVAANLAARRKSSQETIAEHVKQVQLAGKALQNEMRKITKKLGFNILILPGDQDLNELYTKGIISKTMPESYVKKLADSKIMTVNHLLPMLMHRLEWDGPEHKQTILVIGTRGEVPLMHRDPKKPLQGGQKVTEGTLVLGYEVHKQQKLKKGDKVKLMGKDFTIGKLYDQRGNIDDSTIWMNLKEAQVVLGKQNLINAVLALECNCAAADRLGDIRKDIAKILPGTKVIESGSDKALARAEARSQAKKLAEESLETAKINGAKLLEKERENGKKILAAVHRSGVEAVAEEKKQNKQILKNRDIAGRNQIELKKSKSAADLKRMKAQRGELQDQRQSFAAILVPLVIAGCAVWIGLLTFGNVRQRSAEIGILRTLGLQSGQ
ncbi:MAG: hypothetical protein IID45_03255, partial [Planctomycetes bacterium]|nr:hypothetical protein [Planctomycetota bacterium]